MHLSIHTNLLTLLVLISCGQTLGQTVPFVAGEFEKLWTADSNTSWLEGPAYDGAGGVWFTNLKDLSPSAPTDLLRFDIPTGTTELKLTDTGGANGLAFDADGKLLAAHWHDGKLTRRSVDDLLNETVLAAPSRGRPLISPNDIAVAGDGGIYFTDQGGAGVYFLAADGTLSLAASVKGSNGIALSPKGSVLYVTADDTAIVRFDVAQDGTLSGRQIFAEPGGWFDGITTDGFGNVYAPHYYFDSGDYEIVAWNGLGRQVLVFEPPEPCINLTFAPGDVLYVSAVTSLYRVPISFVPEPTTFAMTLLGMTVVVAFGRRAMTLRPDAMASPKKGLR